MQSAGHDARIHQQPASAWTATSASTATSTSRRARTRGSRRSSRRTPPTRTTTGTSASPPSATRPTRASRILDGEGRIVAIVNNYAQISFNFGPTLLAWLEDEGARRLPRDPRGRPREPRALLRPRLGDGAGYNHMILPLANARDKRTQVVWGIRDFEHRFGRAPEGMWLPETAVDLETLEVLAEHGIRFTILAPHQASARPRSASERVARTSPAAGIDPTRAVPRDAALGPRDRPLLLRRPDLARGRVRAAARAAASSFAERLLSARSPTSRDAAAAGAHRHRRRDLRPPPPLRRHGARLRARITSRRTGLARLTNYGEFLETHPADARGARSSRTRPGAARTASSAGGATAAATPAAHPGWNQDWRAPLREALDWLRDALAPLYEAGGARAASRDPVGGARRLHRRDPRPLAGERRALPRARTPRASSPDERARRALEAAGDAAARACSCTRAAAGSSTTSPASRPCRSSSTPGGRSSSRGSSLGARISRRRSSRRLAQAQSNVPEHGRRPRASTRSSVRPARVSPRARRRALRRALALRRVRRRRRRVYCYRVEREDYQQLGERPRPAGARPGPRSPRRSPRSRSASPSACCTGRPQPHRRRDALRGREAYEELVREISDALRRARTWPRPCGSWTGASAPASTRSVSSSATSSGRSSASSWPRPSSTPTTSTAGSTRSTRRSCGSSPATACALPRGFAVAAERALATGFSRRSRRREPDLGRMRAILEEAGRRRDHAPRGRPGPRSRADASRGSSGRLAGKPDDARAARGLRERGRRSRSRCPSRSTSGRRRTRTTSCRARSCR